MNDSTPAPVVPKKSTPDYVLELSTKVDPTRKFTVDDEEFEMYGVEHLSPSEEASVMADLARFEGLQTKLSMATDDKVAERLAVKLRDRRIQLLTKLTSLTSDVAGQLPLPAQVKLISEVQQGAGVDESDD